MSGLILPDDSVRSERKNLWVITAISNPAQWKSRYALYLQFRKHITEELGVNLCTIECALGAGGFHVTEVDEDASTSLKTVKSTGSKTLDVRVRNASWVWLKENLMNVAVKHLPPSADYLLFSDADIRFCSPTMIDELIYALAGTFTIVQPFETCADLGHEGQILAVHKSFGSCHAAGMTWNPVIRRGAKTGVAYSVYDTADSGNFHTWHPGYCMAMRKRTFQKLGGLIEVGVAGAGDHHMMTAIIGRAAESYPSGIHKNYKKAVAKWQDKAKKYVRGNFGFVRGTIHHYHHGPKKNRAYISRWNILTRNAFDPEKDVWINADGVLELASGNAGLREDLRRYFISRNEDDVNNA